MRFGNSNSFFSRVNDEESLGLFLHVGDTAHEFFKLFDFKVKLDNFFLRKKSKSSVAFHNLELSKSLDSLLNRVEVCEHTAEPTCVNIRHTAADCFFTNGIHSLLLCAYEEDFAAVFGNLTNERIRFFELSDCLLKIDDINTVSFGKNILAHLRVPSSCLMAEVNTGFKKLFH